MATVRNVRLRELLLIAARINLEFEVADITIDEFRNIVSMTPVESSRIPIARLPEQQQPPAKSDEIDPNMDINDLIGG